MAQTDKLQTSLRKSPKQKRSQSLFEAVIDAATHILEASADGSITTNKIADRAGVSIGSLYQYFPSKDAIFAKLIERQMNANAARFQKIIDANKDAEVRVVIEKLVDDVVDFFWAKRFFVATLFSEVPKLQKTRDILYRRNATVLLLTHHLKNDRADELKNAENLEEQMYVLSHSIVGVLQTAALENFELHSPEVLRRHLKDLAFSFLLPSAPAPKERAERLHLPTNKL